MNPLYISVSPSSSKEESCHLSNHAYEDVPHTEIVFPNFYYTEPLGQGAYGAVVKCRFRGRLAAVKIAQRKVEYADIHHEARLLHEFKHENIIELYAAFHGTQSGLILELMEGGSLHELLHQQTHIIYQACHVLGWALNVTSALSYLHSRRYVHRDLKSSNMLLTRDYKTLKLCDFGTANDLRTTMANNRGTAMFMAPEVFRGRKYDQKCDIFSLGIFLWEMITRRRPFNDWDAANPYAVLWQLSNGKRPNRITGCPEPVMKLIERCWADVPADRPYADEVKDIIKVLCEIFPNHLLPLINATTGEPVQAESEDQFVSATDSLPLTYPSPARVGMTGGNTRASLPPPHPSDVIRGRRQGTSHDHQRVHQANLKRTATFISQAKWPRRRWRKRAAEPAMFPIRRPMCRPPAMTCRIHCRRLHLIWRRAASRIYSRMRRSTRFVTKMRSDGKHPNRRRTVVDRSRSNKKQFCD